MTHLCGGREAKVGKKEKKISIIAEKLINSNTLSWLDTYTHTHSLRNLGIGPQIAKTTLQKNIFRRPSTQYPKLLQCHSNKVCPIGIKITHRSLEWNWESRNKVYISSQLIFQECEVHWVGKNSLHQTVLMQRFFTSTDFSHPTYSICKN